MQELISTAAAKNLELISSKLGLPTALDSNEQEVQKHHQGLDRELQRKLVQQKVDLAEAQTQEKKIQISILQQQEAADKEQHAADKESLSLTRLKRSLKIFKPDTAMYNTAKKKFIAITCDMEVADVTDEIMQQADIDSLLS